MRRFYEIEGLRAWLAWFVVAWHLVQFFGLETRTELLGAAGGLAATCVDVFIVISGFVITHLVVSRQEPWPQYITRRVFRIFPVYLAVLILGAITSGLALKGMQAAPWTADPSYVLGAVAEGQAASVANHPTLHGLLHVFLIQGVVADSVLPFSSTALLGPAWSLSLEWQFYLIAPFIVAALAGRFRLWVLAGIAAIFAAATAGLLGEYLVPSSLLTSAPLFVVGILTRLHSEKISLISRKPLLAAASALVVGVAGAMLLPQFFAVGLWFAFVALTGAVAAGRLTPWIAVPMNLMFGSRVAQSFGARSFSVYVVHWPVLQAAMFLVYSVATPGVMGGFLAVSLITVPLTLIAAELLHVVIEKPMIGVGARMADAVKATLSHRGGRAVAKATPLARS